ncbi:helix-turn-helix transcriptional regulator [Roseburia hominis]
MILSESIHFSENLIRLRRQKKITQEELASFLGVTKASVSKWETGQSLPDILLLPQLASFFDVTLDELLGFKPQLSKEQIRKIYHELASDFAKQPFRQIMDKSRSLVKKYYACYPFLFQMAVLWLNHFMLAQGPQMQQQILQETAGLCAHIISDCDDIGICNDAILLKSTVDLQLGKAQEVIDALEELLNPLRLAGQSDGVLIRAYLLSGKTHQAASRAQISMYMHLLSLVASALEYLSIKSADLAACEETIRRITALIDTFQIEHLHPNTASSFYYQTAVIYSMHGLEERALFYLAKYEENIRYLLAESNIALHGDAYFDLLDEWITQLDLGPAPPRDKKMVADSSLQLLDHPSFSILQGNLTFKQIKNNLTKEVEKQ